MCWCHGFNMGCWAPFLNNYNSKWVPLISQGIRPNNRSSIMHYSQINQANIRHKIVMGIELGMTYISPLAYPDFFTPCRYTNDWFMDTQVVTDHVHANVGILNIDLKTWHSHSILVVNGSLMPVITARHASFQIHNPYRPLHVDNVLITPKNIKNHISVCWFTKKNVLLNLMNLGLLSRITGDSAT